MKTPGLDFKTQGQPREQDENHLKMNKARSVLECGGPPPFFRMTDVVCPTETARGLAQSKTWRLGLGRGVGGRAGSAQPGAARCGHHALPVLVLWLALLSITLSADAQTYSID